LEEEKVEEDRRKIEEEQAKREGQQLEDALQLKAEGNTLVSQANYDAACEKYKGAVLMLESLHNPDAQNIKLLCFLNLAQVYLKTEKNEEALSFCSKALAIDDQNIKGLFRRGVAYSKIGDLDKAKLDFGKGAELYPSEKDFITKLTALSSKKT